MKKSNSESSFNKRIDESKDLKIEELKKPVVIKKKADTTVSSKSTKWSCCIFYQSEREETIDISLKPNFRGIKK